MSNEMWKAYSRGMAAAMKEGSIQVHALLLQSYRLLGLTDTEVMLLLQIMLYAEREYIDFPTPEQLAERMGTSPLAVTQMLSRLLKEGFLSIEDEQDAETGIQSERYSLDGWLLKAAEWSAASRRESKKAERKPAAVKPADPQNLFAVFEQEFGRLLSPMECETISGWLDEDRYSDEIIRFALKEAVFAGKLNIRYIDRILLEWSRNRVTNAEEARAHAQKFRTGRS
ncbi:DnaD domain protein [Paenibacillus protaetiae]|uniref:DnaD domain protein n=1 Tax=Paenibacillus protaetiae TaxID=2509456 RepID=A0A4P6EZ34_9BACL|nr:DnaD domain protein [Paenibacillus protaetiae]QAY68392.1 DnaD domain protein [Paenibacillus protaetiae]